MKSKILKYIEDNPSTWQDDFTKKHIHVNYNGDLACFKYAIEADFADPLVCEARGIIIDIAEHKVVCWPFDKFFNVQEQYASDIDWGSARVLEKIDGSMIKLFWYKESWRFATSSTCDAKDACVPGYSDLTYADIILQAENYKSIPFEKLDKGKTYIFELVSPQTQVVIKYKMTELYFLSSKSILTGEETDTDLDGFRKPKTFPLKSIDECLKAAYELNDGDVVEKEGFVVVDKMYRRVKIKSPAYVAMHRISTNRVFTVKRMSELFCQGEDFHKLAIDFPADAHIIKFYDWQFAELKHKTENMMYYSRRLYEEYDHDRKAVALAIKDSPYAWAGFKALGNKKDASDLVALLTPVNIEKLISEYQ